jgi:hypothetical protein
MDGRETEVQRMTDVADAELAREQRYVSGLYARLDVLRAELVAELERVRRGGATGTHQARTERDAMAQLFEERVRRLRDVDERLVFGRLQAEDGSKRYIGRIGLRDDVQQPLLLDWRAPQSSAFYQATAATPLGVRIRRHLTTRGRDVTALEDEVFDTEDVPEDATLTGESALMAALTAQRTGRMHDIVNTIQAEQDRIIRSQARGVLVVQGGPCIAPPTSCTPTRSGSPATACSSSAPPAASSSTSSRCCRRSGRPASCCARSASCTRAWTRAPSTRPRSPR